MSTGLLKNIQWCDLNLGEPFCSLALHLLMLKADSKHIMWAWYIAFGTNVKLGPICGLQRWQLLTLLPGDWAAMLTYWCLATILLFVFTLPKCLWAHLSVDCTSAALPPGLSLPNKPRYTAAVTAKVCGVYWALGLIIRCMPFCLFKPTARKSTTN